MTTASEAGQRLQLFADEGRLVQDEWHTERDGRELACALGAMGKEIKSPKDCSASVMPAWLAHVFPVLFDGMALADAIAWAKRMAGLMQRPRWNAVPWGRVRAEFVVGCATRALESARAVASKGSYWPAVESAHAQVVAALRGNGDLQAARSAARSAESAAWDAAWNAAGDAARSAARSAESAARSAENAARSAAESAESAATSAARSAAWNAENATRSAENAARSAAESAESAATSAAASAATSAARSAAWNAARSAESAAWNAARSAESAAWDAGTHLCDIIDAETI